MYRLSLDLANGPSHKFKANPIKTCISSRGTDSPECTLTRQDFDPFSPNQLDFDMTRRVPAASLAMLFTHIWKRFRIGKAIQNAAKTIHASSTDQPGDRGLAIGGLRDCAA
jgi:hypothetical protein